MDNLFCNSFRGQPRLKYISKSYNKINMTWSFAYCLKHTKRNYAKLLNIFFLYVHIKYGYIVGNMLNYQM